MMKLKDKIFKIRINSNLRSGDWLETFFGNEYIEVTIIVGVFIIATPFIILFFFGALWHTRITQNRFFLCKVHNCYKRDPAIRRKRKG